MIVTADIHLWQETVDTVFDEVFPGLMGITEKDPDKTLVILGDFYHIRYKVDVAIQNRVAAIFDVMLKKGLDVIILPGNHDQINIKGENALEVFRKYSNVSVYTEFIDNEYGRWLPYRKDISLVKEAIKAKRASSTPSVLWLHQGILGAMMNDNYKDVDGLAIKLFNKYDLVISGHYHMPQMMGKFNYVGSPYQIDGGEAGQEKGYGILDSENQFNWYPVKWGKRYHKLKIDNDLAKVDLNSIDSNDELRITVSENTDAEDVGKQLKSMGYKNVVVSEKVRVEQNRLGLGGNSNFRQCAEKYCEQFAGKLGVDKLMAVYDEIVGVK